MSITDHHCNLLLALDDDEWRTVVSSFYGAFRALRLAVSFAFEMISRIMSAAALCLGASFASYVGRLGPGGEATWTPARQPSHYLTSVA
jgi:hypothetical protein